MTMKTKSLSVLPSVLPAAACVLSLALTTFSQSTLVDVILSALLVVGPMCRRKIRLWVFKAASARSGTGYFVFGTVRADESGVNMAHLGKGYYLRSA